MNGIIVGFGEIGKSLYNVLSPHYKIGKIDIDLKEDISLPVDILHICFPFSDKFVDLVKEYQYLYSPKYTVIHSTVKPGTTKELKAIFSPVVGIHPHLEESLKTFTKFLAGDGASEVANYFRRAGMKVYLIDNPETLEYAKISQTTFYAVMIEYVKNLKKICDEKGLNFSECYTIPSVDYNVGYEKLGHPEFKMPLLTPILTKQGGHCTRNNCNLWETPFTKIVKELNDEY